MKLLIWSQYFWPENFLINSLAGGLHDHGVDVTVLTGKPNYPEGRVFSGYTACWTQRERYFGINVLRIPLVPRGRSRIGLLCNYLSFIVSGFLFAPLLLRGRRVDAVFVYAPSPLLQALPAIFCAFLKRAKLIVWVQDLWPDVLEGAGFRRGGVAFRIVERVVRYIYSHSDSIMIQSEGFRAPVERLAGDGRSVLFFPNPGRDLGAGGYFSVSQSDVCAEMKNFFSIVFAGNIGKAQSCETLIEAARILRGYRGIRFYLVGNGSAFDGIRCRVQADGLENVCMTGRLAQEEMASVYGAASVLVLSLRDDCALSATVPSKLQGYMSAGRPIIASANGEAAQIVAKARAGVVCPAESGEALAHAVLRLFGMREDERAELGVNARKYFEAHYLEADCVRRLAMHLNSVVSNAIALA